MNGDKPKEQYGGVIQQQSDMAQKALNYRGRFGADENRNPNAAEKQAEIDRVKG